jgi:potassium uptake Trk family protein
MTFLIIIGNTGFPCMLRFIIWVFFKIVPRDSAIKESLNFLLDHPRRCFTLLFPSRETWVLFWVLVGLNLADVILFTVLDLKDPEVSHIAVGHRVVAAIFQAASTRTAGLSVVSIAALHPAVQVSYMLMMYISVFPIAISVRRTNVYEEKSLGLYSGDDLEDDGSGTSYVGAHLRKQLSFDLWYIFLGLFIICIAEGSHIENTTEYVCFNYLYLA